MTKQEKTQHTLKKDRYVKVRGGNSHFLDIYCAKCSQHIVLYQKDGPGSLLRMDLDRILEPQHLLSILQNKEKKAVSLKCSNCGLLIGTPMIYERENRPAFRLIRGSFVKMRSDGTYPPSHRDPGGGNDECQN